jgi:hypothetical protein
MRFLWSAGATLGLVAASSVGAGCSGTDQSPLGGAYGGTASAPPPTHAANVTSNNGGESGASSGSSSTGSSGPSSGTGTSTGSSSGTGATGASGAPTSGSTGGTGGSGSAASGSQGSSGSASASGSMSASGSASGSSSGSGGSSCDTFSCIFTKYLQAGTIGNCSVACHAQMATASSSYSWLAGQGYMGTTPPALTGSRSCLTWYGSGNMPPGGPRSAPQAVMDMNAWAAAGAKNN